MRIDHAIKCSGGVVVAHEALAAQHRAVGVLLFSQTQHIHADAQAGGGGVRKWRASRREVEGDETEVEGKVEVDVGDGRMDLT